MMSELRQAAERLRAWKKDVYHCNMATVQKDTMALAEAYISEHLSDDDEPITDGWFIASVGVRYVFLSKEFAVFISEKCVSITTEAGDSWHNLELPHITTRGQLRQLCRALGVEIKEESK
jgi:hypothetical protein